ncbi:methyltransferase-like protein 1 isoform X1 [Canna indica]|uniref:Methyltransferase-like protein 1 isoform X1 n=1 Tax=Canna indica TaxID=4628 RepID=A0AAQ3KD32_9LILI|nr:methyltransferase-like protein 1 isoform X1 [Canna indica]
MEARGSRAEDYDDWEGAERKKHKSSKSRKHADVEEVDEQESGRRKASDDRSETRKKSGGSSGAGSGDDDTTRRDSRSNNPRKNVDDRTEKRSGDGYRDKELDSSRKRKHDGSEWESLRKTSSKASGHDSSDSKTRSRVENSYDGENEKLHDRDSKFLERKESNKDKRDQVQNDQERNPQRRRWDEVEITKKVDESTHTERSDSRVRKASEHSNHELPVEADADFRNDSGEGKNRVLDDSGEMGGRSSNRSEWKEANERSRSWARSDSQDEETRASNGPRETRSNAARDDRQRRTREKSTGSTEDVEQNAHRHSSNKHSEKGEKQRQERNLGLGNHDEEKSNSMDEDARSRTWGRGARDVRRYKRSQSPDRSGRNYREVDDHDRGFSDSDNERSINMKGSWNDKNREREISKDHWKRSQTRHDSQDVDDFGHMKELDTHRREQERLESENIHIRTGYRKDSRARPEGARGSSAFSNRNESSDSIEIRPNKNLDFGREESVSTFPARKADVGSQQDFVSGASDEEWGYLAEDRGKSASAYREDSQERFMDDGSPIEQNSGRNSLDSQAGKGRTNRVPMTSSRVGAAQSPGGSMQSYGNNQGGGLYNRNLQQGPKGGKSARGGRGRLSGRDTQRVGLPPSMMGPPFGPMGLPPGPMQQIGPNMPTPAPPLGPGVIIPPFAGLVWQGARGVDMNMLPAPPNLPPIPPIGPSRPRFPPNMGTGPSQSMYFNQPGPVRGVSPNISAPGFNAIGPGGREMQHDKAAGWAPSRTSGPSGKAPSRGEQNDYSQNFVDTGMRPQNFIRELELTSVVEDYPKLRELIQRKDEIVSKSASPPMYYQCDLLEHALSPEFFGTKFDVILVDPPWEEYVHRAPGITDNLEYWTFEQIRDLKIEAIADTPSFIFLWVGDGVGLEQGRLCLKKWGFRRCEDICWVKTNKKNATPGLRHDSHTLFQHSKEHCLMGIKGTVRRSTDGHIIHANIDTDVIIAEEPSDAGSTKKPEDMYRIIEHFALGRRRLELFGEDHNIRSGWLTVGKGLSSSNFKAEAYTRNFCDKEGKVWQGGGGRNPPPDAPHLVITTPEIESLRPKSPPQKNQQQQSTPLLPGGSGNRRASGNSPQNPMNQSFNVMNLDLPGTEPPTPAPWSSSPMIGFRGPDGELVGSDVYDAYAFNASFPQAFGGDHIDFDPHRAANLM